MAMSGTTATFLTRRWGSATLAAADPELYLYLIRYFQFRLRANHVDFSDMMYIHQ
jgi:hypothetical protein